MDNGKLKVLFLSFWSPPEIRPRAIAIGKLMPEFLKQGVDPVIVTYHSEYEWKIGSPIYKISPYTINIFSKRNAFVRIFLEYIYYKKNYYFLKKIIKNNKIDVIFSFSNPQASNILGAMIKKKLNIPFISHFSDPWSDNPYKKFKGLGRQKVLFLEKFIIRNSNKVVFTNEEAQGLIMKKYPSSWLKKTTVISHCYDDKDYPGKREVSNGKLILSYVGAFYSERNPEILFEALQKIINTDLESKLELRLIGVVNSYAGYSLGKIKKLLSDYKIDKITKIIAPVSFKESLVYMKNSDCLLVIDANFLNSPFLPSKLFDYAGSRTMILGVTPKYSPTDIFLRKIGYSSFDYNEQNQLAEYLEKIINREVNIKVNKQFLRSFCVENIVGEFIDLFEQSLNN
jgi:glycosyltransferase involved in cell wall biosynthesis